MSMFNILGNSLKLSIKELKVNKLRTALSLTGVAFGIFCIIGVLAFVNSIELNIQAQVNSLGSNTIYIDKWDYSGGPNQPFWKMRARPSMKYGEAGLVKSRSELLDDIAFLMQTRGSISHGDDLIQNASVYGIIEAQDVIQPLKFEVGRYFSASEFTQGTNVCLIGYTNAEDLFGSPERAIGKKIEIKGKQATVVGVIKKEGKNFIGWDYDNCIMLPYKFCRQVFQEDNSNPILIAKGKKGVSTDALSSELKGIMRQVRRLSPTQEDNFSLNSVEAFSNSISSFFSVLNVVGSIIGGISLIVGLFSIANIMFVTVKERTPIIGLKKAIGAKSSSILFEFLLEAALLCILGGAFGLLFVYLATLIVSRIANFPVFISLPMLMATIIICLVVGVLAGIIPASRAAKMDPVTAIRS
ncbi:ABC transporter permease [Ferruginibacter sp. HRS2-29]|uniref:ABC transporter permease n=1 Tax=Ferruginibacter sp. HRS2-29 TaxID=2487334 RepID=UPI0020CBCE9D|nr:ABC transporter permease [Ferruginibacter sp. HRS2-29]MCP9750930.1 ABC transporter permease [Ferruginibacter sp. HRS2-29]